MKPKLSSFEELFNDVDKTQTFEVDYTLVVSKPDADGLVYIHSPEVLGLHLYARPTEALLDVPAAVALLDDKNGRRRP